MVVRWKQAPFAVMLMFLTLVLTVSCKPEGSRVLDPKTGALVSPMQTPPSPTATNASAPPTPLAPRPVNAWTPFPTFPPQPTPTCRPGPTATPVPLLQPAKDAAGFIMYFVADETNTVSLYSQPMDAKGAPQNSPSLLAMTTVATSKAPQYSPPSPNLSAKAEFALPVYFAPDGRRAVLAGEWGIGSILYTDSGRTEPVFRNTIDPQGSFLNWGPDSRHVLIRTEDPDWDLWLVGSDTGDFVKLNNEFHSTGGAVSPDGQKVIYAVQKDFASPGEIWIVDADGTNARRLFTMPGQITFYGMAWSPDGNKIAFMGDGLMIMNADGSNARTISRHSILDNYLFPPIWSPDSRKLAFVTNNLNASQSAIMSGDLNAAAIHLIDVDTGQERPLLLNGTSGNFDPAWSADGSQIAFASTRSGNSEIWVVNVDGTHLRQLTNVGQFARYPYWGRMTGSVQP